MRWKSLKQRKIEHLTRQSKWHTFRPLWPVTAKTARTGTHPIGTTIWLEHTARLKIGNSTYYAPLTVLLTDPYEVEQEELRKKLQGQQAQQIGQALGPMVAGGVIGYPPPPHYGGAGVVIGIPNQQFHPGQLVGGGLASNVGQLGNIGQNANNLALQNAMGAIYQGDNNGGSGS